ncbi:MULTISPECIES: asparagine synthase-related protein [Petrotoga]|uniref:Asparagine synthase (Glutamine-hydrolysing) n=2 Tax=Petrotoga sibirica TaxID=156202 RepID=A0A4R8ER48_9BACT|nr:MULTISPECIES: asparagine synthase-related protein [Petrotoga]POZ88522.1 hypothetical protein AA80_05145 [Petrotoga sibirica DSM 13575]POZ90659.1 hypothetical protein AD60_05955 [Petrotoga sp. SL27]TDX14874.1 asparagine synthase (glutamine-hydrolysing) [Petrotoga sibirica]
MSGIAGTTAKDKKIVNKILNRIQHRGPKSTWVEEGEKATIGCCLLSSEETAKERVFTKEGNGISVLDGHLYHEDNLHLEAAFLILENYRKFGKKFASYLDGDFAFAIDDRNDLILGRDYIGSHPLYYGFNNNELYFSSEAKGLVGIVKEIEELEPGHLFSLKDGVLPYSTFFESVPSFKTPQDAAKILKELLEKAVKRNMSDGFVDGALLSGGLDSSIIAYTASKYQNPIKTFTIGVSQNGDLPRATEMAEFIGSSHYWKIFDKQKIENILPKAIYHLESFEESCVHGAVAHYLTAKFAREKGANCLLCGEGADELLGGYHELKQAESNQEMDNFFDDLMSNAYRTGLQRLDRSFSAHGIEYRTPFLDRRVVNFCNQIPNEWKIYGPEKIEKWILRKTYEHDLPNNIVNRRKEPFANGSGVSDIIKDISQQKVSEFERRPSTFQNLDVDWEFTSPAEFYYYRLFKEFFPDKSYERLVTRWNPLLN